MTTVTEHEAHQMARANESGRPPVVFVHGLWLLPNCWQSWATFFEESGYTALTPGWPDDSLTVDEARAHPEVFAGKRIKQIADHYAEVINELAAKPVLIGHSFGGLLTQMIAGRGLAAASVAISPAPFRGVLPVPIAALKSSWPVLRNPANRKRAVPLTYEQFRYAFANVVTEEEAKRLHETFSVPGSGAMIFQAATANLKSADRGEGRYQERGTWAAADHLHGPGSHGPVVDRERLVQETARKRRRHGDREDLRPGALLHHRQRLAGTRSHGAGFRQAPYLDRLGVWSAGTRLGTGVGCARLVYGL